MELSDTIIAALIGMFGGTVLGLAARLGRFCTLGALEDALYGADMRGLRMWSLAIGTAIAGTFTIAALGWLELADTVYARTALDPAASIVGGVIFGYGMAMAGNCGLGALARLGGGDLRSFVVVVVMGISAYVTLNGPLAALRIALFPQETTAATEVIGFAHLIAAPLGSSPLLPALLIAAALAGWALSDPGFRSTRRAFWAMAAGLAIVSAWLGMGLLSAASFEDLSPVSHRFTAPLGEALLYLMTSSGGGLSFAIGSVAGVLAGALCGALIQAQFRWEACDDPRELGRQIAGAALMGMGGVIALGCSVGQGLTAFSTLAFSAPVVLASIAVGAALGLRHLDRKSVV